MARSAIIAPIAHSKMGVLCTVILLALPLVLVLAAALDDVVFIGVVVEGASWTISVAVERANEVGNGWPLIIVSKYKKHRDAAFAAHRADGTEGTYAALQIFTNLLYMSVGLLIYGLESNISLPRFPSTAVGKD